MKGQKPAQRAASGGGIQSFDDGGDVGPSSDPTQQIADAGAPPPDSAAPITMNVTDLNTGDTTQHAITSDQLQSLVSGTYDSYVAHPQETLWQATQRVANKVGSAIANTPTPEGGEINNMTTTPSGVPVTAQPEGWQNRSSPSINPGSVYQGEKVTGNQPGVSPAVQAYNNANPQRQLGSPGEPSVADFERAYGNRMQQNAGLAGRAPTQEEQAAIDKMNEQGGTPNVPEPSGSSQQTETLPNGRTRVTEAALGNPVTETKQETEDIINQNAAQHQQDLAEAIMLKNAGINPGNIGRPEGATTAPRSRQGVPGRQAGQRAPAARAKPAARPPIRAGRTRGPRRVYGSGHAGLGTYQELADGTAQYLGPQNMTG